MACCTHNQSLSLPEESYHPKFDPKRLFGKKIELQCVLISSLIFVTQNFRTCFNPDHFQIGGSDICSVCHPYVPENTPIQSITWLHTYTIDGS